MFWVKKFIKNIVYSKEEILITLYYKKTFGEKGLEGNSSGCPHPAAAISTGFEKEKCPSITGASFNMAPPLEPVRTVDIVLPNLIHSCKDKGI